jgi:hypothetical protein
MVLRSAAYPTQSIRLMMTLCGKVMKNIGILGMSVRKMKALTVKETVTATGKG